MTGGAESARPRVELIWFGDCPNHPLARTLLEEIMTALAPGTTIDDIDATDPTVARRHRFAGSPTIWIEAALRASLPSRREQLSSGL
jgi:hypothetical protein